MSNLKALASALAFVLAAPMAAAQTPTPAPPVVSTVSASPTPSAAQAQAVAQIGGGGPVEERAAVLTTLQTYLRIFDNNEEAAIGRSFHPAATLMSTTRGGAVQAMTQDVWWERISRGQAQRSNVIRYIDVQGLAAIARIDITKGANTSTDFFNLLHTRNGWRIVNKVLSTPLN